MRRFFAILALVVVLGGCSSLASDRYHITFPVYGPAPTPVVTFPRIGTGVGVICREFDKDQCAELARFISASIADADSDLILRTVEVDGPMHAVVLCGDVRSHDADALCYADPIDVWQSLMRSTP